MDWWQFGKKRMINSKRKRDHETIEVSRQTDALSSSSSSATNEVDAPSKKKPKIASSLTEKLGLLNFISNLEAPEEPFKGYLLISKYNERLASMKEDWMNLNLQVLDAILTSFFLNKNGEFVNPADQKLFEKFFKAEEPFSSYAEENFFFAGIPNFVENLHDFQNAKQINSFFEITELILRGLGLKIAFHKKIKQLVVNIFYLLFCSSNCDSKVQRNCAAVMTRLIDSKDKIEYEFDWKPIYRVIKKV